MESIDNNYYAEQVFGAVMCSVFTVDQLLSLHFRRVSHAAVDSMYALESGAGVEWW